MHLDLPLTLGRGLVVVDPASCRVELGSPTLNHTLGSNDDFMMSWRLGRRNYDLTEPTKQRREQ